MRYEDPLRGTAALGNEGLLHVSDCGFGQNGNTSKNGAEAGRQHKIIYFRDLKEKERNKQM